MPASTERSTRKRALLVAGCGLVVIAMVWVLSTCVWYSPGITGRVVDPDGIPVAKAVVVANWNLQRALSGATAGQLALIEVRTDANGYFHIPSWGPRFDFRGGLSEDQPFVRVFKPGFVPLIVNNTDAVPMRGIRFVSRSRVDGATLVLRRFNGRTSDYEAALGPLLQNLFDLVIFAPRGTCYWKNMPRLLLSLQDVKHALDPAGGQSIREAHLYMNINDEKACGNAKQFFEGFHQSLDDLPPESLRP